MERVVQISPSVRESFPEDWPDWVLVSLTELEASESSVDDNELFESLPEWAKSILMELIKPMLPSIKWKYEGQSGPEFLGKILGHQEYLFESDEVAEAMEKNFSKLKNPKVKSAYAFSEKQMALLPQIGKEIAVYWTAGIKHLENIIDQKSAAIKSCRNRAFEQPFEVVQEFNKAYAEAQSTSLYNVDGNVDGLSTRNKVRTTLLVFMPIVNHDDFFQSLPDLHRWIVCAHQYEIMSFDSFRKMCNEHGLSYVADDREK